jgi:hypothetical protein
MPCIARMRFTRVPGSRQSHHPGTVDCRANVACVHAAVGSWRSRVLRSASTAHLHGVVMDCGLAPLALHATTRIRRSASAACLRGLLALDYLHARPFARRQCSVHASPAWQVLPLSAVRTASPQKLLRRKRTGCQTSWSVPCQPDCSSLSHRRSKEVHRCLFAAGFHPAAQPPACSPPAAGWSAITVTCRTGDVCLCLALSVSRTGLAACQYCSADDTGSI